jgi:hypothetical protein
LSSNTRPQSIYLFDWLVIGQIIPMKLCAEEMGALLTIIDSSKLIGRHYSGGAPMLKTWPGAASATASLVHYHT